MVQSVSNDTIVNIFKRVYADKIQRLVPEGYPLMENIEFQQRAKTGESYIENVILSNETGITLGGSAADVIDLNPARAGSVKQATAVGYQSILTSYVPWGVLSRSAGGGDKAFVDGTKHIIKSNLKSHMQFAEVFGMYGQAAALLGYVSYATATYRGVSLTNGTGTVGGVAFTNGVNTTSKAILMAPGSFASGIWVGMEGAAVKQLSTGSTVVANGSLLSVDSENGILYVDFTPVAASSTTSHRLCFEGQENAKEAPGVNAILANTGTLFGISAATSGGYSLWRGTTVALSNVLLTFARLQSAASQAVNRGGASGDYMVLVNPRTFATMINDQSALRKYDSSYKGSEFENGAESLKFHYAYGAMDIMPSRFVKEGEAYGLMKDTWVRGGSSEISFTIPGINKEVIFPAENSNTYIFRTFSDQFWISVKPAQNFLITGINDESAS